MLRYDFKHKGRIIFSQHSREGILSGSLAMSQAPDPPTARDASQPASAETVDERKAFERVQLARHPERPYTLDFVERLFENFVELHGDRRYGDDPAIVGGLASFHGLPVVVIGQQKGRDTKQRRYRNFGMPKPEGYRKALRLMKLAEKFGRPVFCFIDTPGAYPGIDAEERGQAEAIAYNLREMAKLQVPSIVTVIGEGGSGGALAIGVGDQVLMLENAIYSVITPEGCAAILWRDSSQAERAAASLRLTAEDLLHLGVVDRVVQEPVGGAHTEYDRTAQLLDSVLSEGLAEVVGYTQEQRQARRYGKLRKFGKWGFV
jgi:acetyl-CoA carboxylase carboxyl transferase subunit alpha